MLQVCHVFKFFNPTELEKFKQIISFCAGNFENFLCWHSFVLDWTRILGHCAGLDRGFRDFGQHLYKYDQHLMINQFLIHARNIHKNRGYDVLYPNI